MKEWHGYVFKNLVVVHLCYVSRHYQLGYDRAIVNTLGMLKGMMVWRGFLPSTFLLFILSNIIYDEICVLMCVCKVTNCVCIQCKEEITRQAPRSIYWFAYGSFWTYSQETFHSCYMFQNIIIKTKYYETVLYYFTKTKKVDFHLFHYKCNVISEKVTYTKTSKNEE